MITETGDHEYQLVQIGVSTPITFNKSQNNSHFFSIRFVKHFINKNSKFGILNFLANLISHLCSKNIQDFLFNMQ